MLLGSESASKVCIYMFRYVTQSYDMCVCVCMHTCMCICKIMSSFAIISSSLATVLPSSLPLSTVLLCNLERQSSVVISLYYSIISFFSYGPVSHYGCNHHLSYYEALFLLCLGSANYFHKHPSTYTH